MKKKELALGNDGGGTHCYIFCVIRSEQATGELHSNENLQIFILRNSDIAQRMKRGKDWYP